MSLNNLQTEIKKKTLHEFIDENSKIFSVTGVFSAVTLFTLNTLDKGINVIASSIFFIITLILWVEVFKLFPKDIHSMTNSLEWFMVFLYFGVVLLAVGFLIAYSTIVKYFLPTTICLLLDVYIFKYSRRFINKIFASKRKFLKTLYYIFIIAIMVGVNYVITFIVSPKIIQLFDLFIGALPK